MSFEDLPFLFPFSLRLQILFLCPPICFHFFFDFSQMRRKEAGAGDYANKIVFHGKFFMHNFRKIWKLSTNLINDFEMLIDNLSISSDYLSCHLARYTSCDNNMKLFSSHPEFLCKQTNIMNINFRSFWFSSKNRSKSIFFVA